MRREDEPGGAVELNSGSEESHYRQDTRR